MLTGFVEEVSRTKNIIIREKIPFVDRIFEYNYLKNIYPKELDKSSNFLFSLNRFNDFIRNVVNFPQICAFYAFYENKKKYLFE